METEEKKRFCYSRSRVLKYLITILFIASGVLMFARNMGYISSELFDIIVSWPSLLTIGGLYIIYNRNYFTGCIITLWGAYLILQKIPNVPVEAQQMIWPAILILCGIFFFLHSRKSHFHSSHMHHFHKHGSKALHFDEKIENSESTDGFLKSDNNFGAIKHVMLDEVFKGGLIKVNFGGTTIDLRHTKLQEGTSYIDVDCNWGGIELYLPYDWKVVNRCNVFVGGCDDKRNSIPDNNKVLVIRGNISFGGLEIKG